MLRVAVPAAALLVASCGVGAETATPSCDETERVALVAQAVPSASYVPCLAELPAGWQVTGVDVDRGSARVTLLSDRSDDHPVEVVLEQSCDTAGASPAAPRAAGVRSSVRLDAVAPLYVGTALDAFPGGCVRYEFAFPRGPHIPLMEELAAAVELLPRRELRLRVRDELGLELDP